MSACLHLRPDHTPATVPKARCPLQALSAPISHGQAEGKVISPISLSTTEVLSASLLFPKQ